MTDSNTPSSPDPQQPATPQQPGSLGQGYSQSAPDTPNAPAGGQPQAPYQQPGGQQPGGQQPRPSQYQQPGYPQQGAAQPGYPQQGAPRPGYPQGYQQVPPQGQPQQQSGPGFAQQASAVGGQFGKDATQVAKGAGDGLGALFSDLQFKKSLTGKLASIVFLGAILWALLNFITNLTVYWGSTAGYRNMGGGSAFFHTVTDVIFLLFFIIVVRILLEAALNIAKIAGRDKDSSSAQK